MALTKQDLESIGKIVESKTIPILQEMRADFAVVRQDMTELRNDIQGLREQIQQLTITLDNFVKTMTDYKEEFAILKAEVDQMKRIFKEKLGVEIAVQK